MSKMPTMEIEKQNGVVRTMFDQFKQVFYVLWKDDTKDEGEILGDLAAEREKAEAAIEKMTDDGEKKAKAQKGGVRRKKGDLNIQKVETKGVKQQSVQTRANHEELEMDER